MTVSPMRDTMHLLIEDGIVESNQSIDMNERIERINLQDAEGNSEKDRERKNGRTTAIS